MTDNTGSNILLIVGFVVIGLGVINLVGYQQAEEKGLAEAKLAEERYMQEHYGYKDNMKDYLDYLKQTDIDTFMKLKPVWEDMQYDYSKNPFRLYLAVPLIIGGLILMLIALGIRE